MSDVDEAIQQYAKTVRDSERLVERLSLYAVDSDTWIATRDALNEARMVEAITRNALRAALSEPRDEGRRIDKFLIGYAREAELGTLASPGTISYRMVVYPPEHAPKGTVALYVDDNSAAGEGE